MAVATAPRNAPEAPAVSGWPVVGPVFDVQRDLLGLYARAQRECGDVARLVTGVPPLRQELHLVMHPDGVRHVLAASSRGYGKDTPVYEELRAYLGSGLLTSQDAAWERQKRLLQPLFTPRRVAAYAAVMQQEADELVRAWRRCAGGEVDLHASANRYTMRVVGRLLFGSALEEVVEVVERVNDPLQRHMVFRGLAPARLPRSWPTPGALRAERCRRQLHRVVDGVVAGRKQARGPGEPDGASDLVTLLLGVRDPHDGSRLSDTEVREQALIFVLAGQETTAIALTFTLHLLGRHPAVQARVRAEAEECGDPVVGLPWTRHVVHEAMRLYPPVCHIPRSARRDDVVLGYAVPRGATVFLPTWVVHRDPRWWPDPSRFDPERFAVPAAAGRHRYAYLPFGGGPRACIGAQFALLEASIAVAAVVRAYSVVAGADLPPLFPGITLRPRGRVPARLEAVGAA